MPNEFSVPYGRHNIDQEDIDSVVETLRSDFLTQGPMVKAFEESFAEYVGVKYALAVSNATAGLHLSVLSLGLKPGERVITTPITFAASANCISYSNGEVWLADIDPDTYLLSFEKVKKLIESKPKNYFKGIIPVDFAGLPVDLEKFRSLADQHDLWLIEDASHSPGAYFINSIGEREKCGNGNYADLSVFSFHPVKHIACGEGGMITTNSKELYDKLCLLRTHGISKREDLLQENHGGWYYEMLDLGFNYRLSDIQAALGVTQLKKNKEGVVKRNGIANKYIQAFEGKIKYQSISNKAYNAYHLFIIEVEQRKELYEYLRMNGVYSQIHYIPIHLLPFYKQRSRNNECLNHSEKYYNKCISLPMYPTLKEEEQNFVIKKTLDFFGY